MAERDDLTEAERKALEEMAALRRKAKGAAPVSASFRNRMASATVDPGAPVQSDEPPTDSHHDSIIFRP